MKRHFFLIGALLASALSAQAEIRHAQMKIFGMD